MSEVVRVVGYVIGGAWLLLLVVCVVGWGYVLVMSWLIDRAWEPVEALAREVDEDLRAEAEDRLYLAWLEATWGSRVPRVPVEGEPGWQPPTT